MEYLHDVVVSKVWGQEPVAPNEYRDLRLLDSAVGRPFQSAFGREPYGTILEKGAALFHSLISNHPFQNGNKRTAVLALDCFLLANNYYLLLSNNEMYKLAKDTATYRERRISHDAIFQHIVRRLRKGGAVPLRHLRRQPHLARFQRITMESRRRIRRHELNRQQPSSD